MKGLNRQSICGTSTEETKHGKIWKCPLGQYMFKEGLALSGMRCETFVPEFCAIVESARIQKEESNVSSTELDI
jgi:hypothetical protein